MGCSSGGSSAVIGGGGGAGGGVPPPITAERRGLASFRAAERTASASSLSGPEF
jgi:hypothetical protein